MKMNYFLPECHLNLNIDFVWRMVWRVFAVQNGRMMKFDCFDPHLSIVACRNVVRNEERADENVAVL